MVDILQRHFHLIFAKSSESCAKAFASTVGIQSGGIVDDLCDALPGYLCGSKRYHPGASADYDSSLLVCHAGKRVARAIWAVYPKVAHSSRQESIARVL